MIILNGLLFNVREFLNLYYLQLGVLYIELILNQLLFLFNSLSDYDDIIKGESIDLTKSLSLCIEKYF